MKKSLLLLATAIAGLASATLAQDAASSSYPSVATDIQPVTVTDPQEFTNKAAIGNMFEIETSELAANQASDPAIKSFAQQMIADHGKASQDLMTAATAQGGVTVPADLDQPHADKLAQLQAATGADFDRLYVQMQTDAHVEAVGLFAGYSTGGSPGPLKDFATATLPTLQHHYDMVLTLQR
jgi:putative membrane protein